jgi:hypothetical protein
MHAAPLFTLSCRFCARQLCQTRRWPISDIPAVLMMCKDKIAAETFISFHSLSFVKVHRRGTV